MFPWFAPCWSLARQRDHTRCLMECERVIYEYMCVWRLHALPRRISHSITANMEKNFLWECWRVNTANSISRRKDAESDMMITRTNEQFNSCNSCNTKEWESIVFICWWLMCCWQATALMKCTGNTQQKWNSFVLLIVNGNNLSVVCRNWSFSIMCYWCPFNMVIVWLEFRFRFTSTIGISINTTKQTNQKNVLTVCNISNALRYKQSQMPLLKYIIKVKIVAS